MLGFAPALRMEGLAETGVPASVADEALAVIGEALSNVARHTRAPHTEVSLAAIDTGMRAWPAPSHDLDGEDPVHGGLPLPCGA